MKVCYFGHYQRDYPRNKNIILGLQKNGVEVVEIQDRAPGLKKFWNLYRKHRALKNNYDLMIVGFPGHIMMPFAWLICRKSLVFDVHVSFFEANVYERKRFKKYSPGGIWYYLLDWLSCFLADVVLLDAEAHVKYFCELLHMRKEKFLVWYHGINPELWQPVGGTQPSDKFVIEFHGYIQILNGMEFVMEAMHALRKYSDIELWIIGSGPEYPKTKHLAQEVYKLPNVKFFPVLPPPELVQKVACAKLGLGTFGTSKKADRVIANKIYEMMAMKIPVLTAFSNAVHEQFNHKEHIYFVEVASAQSIANGILEIYKNPSLREAIRDNAYRKMIDELSPGPGGRLYVRDLENFLHTYGR